MQDATNAYFLAGSWLNCMLYAAEAVFIAQYLMQPCRPRNHKLVMSLLFVFDSICTLSILTEAYFFVLELPFVTETPGHVWTSVALTIFATYASASLTQILLCNIFFVLTKQRILTAFLVVSIFAHAGFSYASAGILLATQSPLGMALETSKIGGITCAVTDILIAIALTTTFIRLDTHYAFRRTTHSLLRRLAVLIGTSGVLVASTTLLNTVLLLAGSPAQYIFYCSRGRVYALTILANLLLGNPGQNAGQGQGLTLTAAGAGRTAAGVESVVFRVGTLDAQDDSGPTADADADADADDAHRLDTLPKKTRLPGASASSHIHRPGRCHGVP
ncbi:hypothetical protein MKEN_00550600 [Mycena kentingensis (nom. inval.)]|nr:hypothetical protein MKEN_00550600 [Mycena kentingensis (nom. inval.)]